MHESKIYLCDWCTFRNESARVVRSHEKKHHPEEITERAAEELREERFQEALMNVYNSEDGDWDVSYDNDNVEIYNVDFVYDEKIIDIKDLKELVAIEDITGSKVTTFTRKHPAV